MFYILVAVFGALAGGAGGYVYRKKIIDEKNLNTTGKAEAILHDAKNKAKDIVFDAKNEVLKAQEEWKKEERHLHSQLDETEERLMKREKVIDKKNDELDKAKTTFENKVVELKSLQEDIELIYNEQSSKLEEIAAMSQGEAKEMLLKKVEDEAKGDIVDRIQKAEAEFKLKVDEKAKWIISDAIARCASETTAESTATIVSLPSDDMKGRIIGREGRNINTFEQMTGVDVIVDDTPGSIVISGFDLVRRYVAKVSLEKLVEDGRIHPARIEETVLKVKDEVNLLIKEFGDKAVMETGVTGLHSNLIKILGRLKFRVTHGQNALKHSVEVSFLAASLASEVGADVAVCKRAGLLHDIGKAVDHDIPGHHSKIGADIARKFGLSKAVVHAIEAHHNLVEPQTVEAYLVQAANLIANARPGATDDNLDSFIKRLTELENVCNSFDGVKSAYAIQSGAEVRIFVDPTELDDLSAIKLSYDVARKIEYDLQHPGPVKVHVIREVESEEYAT